MATVLVSVALVAASIWIAIRMESVLDSPAARALPADTGPMRPARCRFRHPGTRPAARPVRCTQRSPPGRPRLYHPFPPGQGADRDHDRGQAPQPVRAGVNRAVRHDCCRGGLSRQRQPLLLPVPAPPVSGAGQRPAVEGDRPA
jgi:hypothetical protein